MLRSDQALAQFFGQEQEKEKKSETKTSTNIEGACNALRAAVEKYQTACGGLGRKTKDNKEWRSVVGKYYGLKRLSQKKWDEVCEKVIELGLLTTTETEAGRSYWVLSETKKDDPVEDQKEDPAPVKKEDDPVEDQEPSRDLEAFEYDPEEEPEDAGWEGFTEEEIEVIDIMNAAYLRGHTLQAQNPTAYNAHLVALSRGEPLSIKARIKKKNSGLYFGYCCDADGHYTGGLCNCAVLSARTGMGIMSKEEKKRVKETKIQFCLNCPHKK